MNGTRWHWCFAHSEMVVVPVEAISSSGLCHEFAEALESTGGMRAPWVRALHDAIIRYWQRARALHEIAPRDWFPPRAQHICIVRRGHRVRPYFQPIYNGSWLLYEDDFDPATSSPEFGTYLLFHAERMGWHRQVLAAFERNLSYWLVRTEEEVADFCNGARRSTRPDARALQALADALPWIRMLYHPALRPPSLAIPGGLVPLGASGLLGPRTVGEEWAALQRRWQRVAERVVEQHYRSYKRVDKDRVRAFCCWLETERPEVLVVGERMDIVWDPALPDDTSRVKSFLAGSSADALASVQADLKVIDHHSLSFRRAACEEMPAQVGGVEPGGLSFLWPGRAIIAYRLGEPGMDRLRLPAPPYERLMLGARTMHEWGHLAASAGWVGIPAESEAKGVALCARLEDICERVVRDAPTAVRAALSHELEKLATQAGVGRALANIVYARMEDYRANVVAREFLSPLELETYVRNNVTCLQQSTRPTALFQRLVRYAYEFQYLHLLGLRDPWSYLCSSTWFDREYWLSGVVSRSLTEELFHCVAEMCALQQIDESKLHVPSRAANSPRRQA
ncbi:MAG: hypothetical protein N3C12_11960 [Candidatus Binatia bacterium]|nr:hypothetical protein [Candidatus Binatia bacterium]